jgi:hypothetical protein
VCSEMSAETERTDGELLAAVASGDGAAFAVFYRRHLPAVVAFLVRETGDREVSADLAAEVFSAGVAGRAAVPATRDWFGGSVGARDRSEQARESRRRGRVEDRARRRLAFEPVVLTNHDLARVDELAGAGGAGVQAAACQTVLLRRLREQRTRRGRVFLAL